MAVTSWKMMCLLSTAGIAASLFPVAAAAQADSAARSENSDVHQEMGGDIIVTAQRREESLQKVPVAISALGSESLANRQVVSARDLAGSVPSLDVTGQRGGNASASFAIRGLADLGSAIGSPSLTAVYLDGVYLAVPDAAVFELDAVERLEVLRGPQGTLYGRNATAGAINIITRAPTDHLTAEAELSYGNMQTYRAKAWLSGSLTEGLTASLSGALSGRGDYLTNLYPGREGEKLGARNSKTIRGKLRYEGANFDATLSGDYSRDTSVSHNVVITDLATGAYVGFGDGNVIWTSVPDFIRNKNEGYGGNLTINADVTDDLTLTSITALRKNEGNINLDFWGKPIAALTRIAGFIDRKTFSQEIKGFYTGDRLKATFGLNYYHETGGYIQIRNPTSSSDTSYSPIVASTLKAYAAFGQLEYDVTDTLTAVAGLRVNHEVRDYDIDYTRSPATPRPIFKGRLTGTDLPWNVGLNFQPTSSALLYAKVSQGYLGKGFNPLPGNGYRGDPAFAGQSVRSYEIGAKTQWFDKAVTLNVAGFYYKYNDIAARSTTLDQFLIANDADGTGKGVEMELSLNPVRGLNLSGNLSYVHATYSSYCEPLEATAPALGDAVCTTPGGQVGSDRSGNFMNDAPEWMWGVHLSYEQPLSGEASLTANVSYNHQSNSFFRASNNPLTSSMGGYNHLNAKLSFKANENFELYLYGSNLTNDRYITYSAQSTAAAIIGFVDRDPRSYGIGAKIRF